MNETKPRRDGTHATDEDAPRLVAMIKSLASTSRLEVMQSLMHGERTFHDLLRETRLKKTALANHLSQLLDTGLIEKPGHGSYAISKDGTGFITAIHNAYDTSLAKAKIHAARVARGSLSEEFMNTLFGSRES